MTTMPPRFTRLPLAALLLASALSACSSTKDELEYVERPAEQIYQEADTAMQDERFKTAARLFDEVERQHP